MKYKIGIFGSSAGDLNKVLSKAAQLGEALGAYRDKVIVITGGCGGLPYAVAKKSHDMGVELWGFSPTFDLKTQNKLYPDEDNTIYDRLIYIPRDYELAEVEPARRKSRNVSSTAACDAGIIVSGRWGTLNEFTNLIDMGKIVGVLTETGGIADELQDIANKISKEGQGKLIFERNPNKLVSKVMKALN